MIDSTSETAPRGAGTTLQWAIRAAVWNDAACADVARLRAQVAAAFPNTLSHGVLKQSDEQNLFALLALKQALTQSGLSAEQCSDWGLVAIPRSPGRKRVADSLTRFREQGAWSVSPHLIPNVSLHSASGLFSQALRLHGPNIGAGGIAGTENEGLWAALAMLEGERLPGVWTIWTGWDCESLHTTNSRCQVAVLALQPEGQAHQPALKLTLDGERRGLSPFSLESLGAAIQARHFKRWDIGGATCSMDSRSIQQGVAA